MDFWIPAIGRTQVVLIPLLHGRTAPSILCWIAHFHDVWIPSGRLCQLQLILEKMRCSILFHFLVPGSWTESRRNENQSNSRSERIEAKISLSNRHFNGWIKIQNIFWLTKVGTGKKRFPVTLWGRTVGAKQRPHAAALSGAVTNLAGASVARCNIRMLRKGNQQICYVPLTDALDELGHPSPL